MELTKVLAIHLTILLSVLASRTRAVCCHRTNVFFYSVFDCDHFFAKTSGELCFLSDACPNGDRVTVGPYCGEGNCNIFGCNCEGGCRGGNTSEDAMLDLEIFCRRSCIPVLNEYSPPEKKVLKRTFRDDDYEDIDIVLLSGEIK